MSVAVEQHPLPQSHFDVVVIGGGMVGLVALAVLTHQLPDAQILLIESHPLEINSQSYQPSFDSRSTAISSGSVDVLRHIGLWPKISEHATEIQKVHVSDGGHFGRTSYSHTENHGRSLGYVVENAWLGNRLIQHAKTLQNVEFKAPATVNKITPTEKGVVLSVCDNKNAVFDVFSDLVIVADGAQSPLRKSLGMGVERDSYSQHAIVVNVEYERSHQSVAFERFTEHGPMALLPLGESRNSCRSALIWVTNDHELEKRMSVPEDEFLRLIQDCFGFRLGRFLRVSRRHAYPLERIICQEQIRSSIVIMGNAAHYLHPVAGQGFNLSVRDIARLAESLLDGHQKQFRYGELSVLQLYLSKQQEDQWMTSLLSHQFIKVFGEKNRGVQLLRNMGLLGLQLVPPLKQTFFSQMMGRGMSKSKII